MRTVAKTTIVIKAIPIASLMSSDFASGSRVIGHPWPARDDHILWSLEYLLALGAPDRFLTRDLAAPHQVLQALVERLHAVLLASLDRGIHLRDLVLADQVADRGNADHDFMRGDAAAADLLQQRLRNHRAQRLGQHRTHHRLFARGEHVDDAVD